MGRTNPTYRDRLRRLEDEWRDYRRALRLEEQRAFDRLFEHGRAHADAAGFQNEPDPTVPFLVSILLEHQQRVATLENRLERVQTLEERLAALEEGRDDLDDADR